MTGKSVNRASEVWQEIKPYAMQDLKAMQSGSKIIASSSGYQIILYSQKTRYYDADSDGLSAAIAAAEVGDTISLPTISIGGNHTVPEGVSLIGIDRNRSILTGQITLSLNAHLNKVSVVRSGSSGTLKGVILSGNNARVYNCVVDITNSGGGAIGVYCNTGVSGYVDDCVVAATASGDGYGCYIDTAYLYIQAGRISGSTAETFGSTAIYHLAGMENVFKDTPTVAWSYNAVAETFEAVVLPGGVNHDSLLNYVGNKHINHGDVEIIAGNGLAGGGDILASRTINIGEGNGITVSADSIAVNMGYGFVWTNDHTFQANIIGRHILPEITDTYDLGSTTKLWRKGYLSELDAVIFAQNTITLLGGWLMITKNEGTFAGDVADSDTSIDFGQSMTVGDFILCRAAGQVEYFQVGSLVSGTTYNVTRNLDGSGANDWPSGTPYAILGASGDGRIELNAYDSPRVQLIQQGVTYNAQDELIRIGDLNGDWGYSSSIFGIAIGKYGAGLPNLTMDAINGLRIRSGSNDVMQFDVSGNALITNKLKMSGVNSAIAIGSTPPTSESSGTGIWLDRSGLYGLLSDSLQIKIDGTTGKLLAGNGAVILSEDGIDIEAAAAYDIKNSINFFDGSANNIFKIYGTYVGSVINGYIAADAQDKQNLLTMLAATSGSQVQANAMIMARSITSAYGTKYSYISMGISAYGEESMNFYSEDFIFQRAGGDPGCNLNITGNLQATNYKKGLAGSVYTCSLFVPLTSPLTSTSWDGDARSSTGKTKIDLSAVFGVPAGVKAVLVRLIARDSGSLNNNVYVLLSPNSSSGSGNLTAWPSGKANDKWAESDGMVPCDSNGDIYYQIGASGSGTMDVILEIWGYWI